MNSLIRKRDTRVPGRKGSIQWHVVSIAAPSLQLFKKIKELLPILEAFEIPYEVSIVAAHRAPKQTLHYIQSLEKKESK